MNRYIFLRRLTGPAVLLLLGTVALLHQADLVSWNIFVPLLLILIGVIKLAERAVLASEPYPWTPYMGGVNPAAGPGAPPNAGPAASSVVPTHDYDSNSEGGKL